MKQASPGLATGRLLPLLVCAPLLMFVPVACGGPAATSQNSVDRTRADLQSITFGRLVDVYSYQRIDTGRPDRRDQLNRQAVLVAKDVVIRPGIATESLFDPAGDVSPTANYQFMPFDVTTGHDELLILWDNRDAEAVNFQTALDNAQLALTELPPTFRGQDTSLRPIPVMPRDAAIVLTFSRNVGVDQTFFDVNPTAIQLLEFAGDPHVVQPQDAFRSVPYRLVVKGNKVILDPTILGGEARGGFLASGLPESTDNATANIRIAVPSRGGVSSAFQVSTDPVAELNDLDSTGRESVIRDFRSGNAVDGPNGVLRDLEAPVIVGKVSMGIMSIDAGGVITVNKRQAALGHAVYPRGRFPFVAGALSPVTGFALGPTSVPATRPLRSGDFLEQTVTVRMPDGTFEPVNISAEILQNLEVGTVLGDASFAGVGLDANGTQGDGPTARLRVGPIRGVDSLGRPVTAFVANGLPEGQDCILRRFYVEHLNLNGGSPISDVAFRHDFLKVDPKPTGIGGAGVDPFSTVALEFSEPMDLQRIDPSKNIVLTGATMPGPTFATDINNAKVVSNSVLPVRWSDQSGDGTIIQLQPPKGFFHAAGATNDIYWFHLQLGAGGLADLGGNLVNVFNDDIANPTNNWSAQLTVDVSKPRNLVGWHLYPFENADEDGTTGGSIDLFGQYQIRDGRLFASPTVRFSRTADRNNLGTISRTNRGECTGAVAIAPGGVLYRTPRMVDVVAPPAVPNPYPDFQTVSQPVGQVIEPHQLRGSRMMMRYIEDDFALSYRSASDFAIDVEQLYWSPFADFDVLFDVFDRYTMALGHADKRPDVHWEVRPVGNPPVQTCVLICNSMNSSLSTNFADNLLRGSSPVTVFEDKVYRIDPSNMFTDQAVKYIAYPKFDRTYTWRDSRLVTLDSDGNVIGLGGAREPGIPGNVTTANDWTADIDSPWVPSGTATQSGIFVRDDGDFNGSRKRDHDPIALPLLVDFKMFPDGPGNSLARSVNGFQMAMIGDPSNFANGSPGGYYNLVGAGCPLVDPWPLTRVHTTGGINPNGNVEVLVDPANTPVATGGFVKDAGAIIMSASPFAATHASFRAPAGDGMINWARADFVRKVSTVTFGFFDTMQPNRRAGPPASNGYPDFNTNIGTAGITEFVSLIDPPLSRQPTGTSIVLEIRCAAEGLPSSTLYNSQLFVPTTNQVETVTNRGNLLNPSFACDAYRYSQGNAGQSGTEPRLQIPGLTKYVTEDRLSEIANPTTGRLPRYMNFRLVMTNNIAVTPALSPSLRSFGVVYRMVPNSGN